MTGMEIVSVWGITTIAALIFPYVKRAKGIWESSPYKTWKFLGVPLVTWGARSRSSIWASSSTSSSSRRR